MADSKLLDLPASAALTGTEVVYGVQSGNDVQITTAAIGALGGGTPITGGASTIVSSNLTANRALISSAAGKVAVATTTSTEIGYVNGVTSAIQAQLNAKQGAITLTTTGTSGAATLVGNALNIPNYATGGGGGSGTVTNVSVTTLNGVSAAVTNPTTTPDLQFTLGNITPTSVSISGTAGAGFIWLPAQSTKPTAPPVGSVNVIADPSGRFSWQHNSGFYNTFRRTSYTQDALFTLPDASVQLAPIPPIFGSGSDGNLTISSGTTTLARSTYYNNVTISGTAKLSVVNNPCFISGALDLTNAGADAITCIAANGGNSVVSAAGAAGSAQVTGAVAGNSGNGTAGAAGGVAAGAAAGVPAGMANALTPGTSGSGGGSGAGSGGIAASGRAGVTPTQYSQETLITTSFIRGVTLQLVAGGGAGGSSGGGDGTNSGAGGGGGGAGGGILPLYARSILVSASTAAGAISAAGGAGGVAGTVTTGNVGGGGGAGGGTGGFIYIVAGSIVGSAINVVSAPGGNAGNGSVGAGTGGAGAGGRGGGTGQIQLLRLDTGITTISAGSLTGNVASGITGGTGATCFMSF